MGGGVGWNLGAGMAVLQHGVTLKAGIALQGAGCGSILNLIDVRDRVFALRISAAYLPLAQLDRVHGYEP